MRPSRPTRQQRRRAERQARKDGPPRTPPESYRVSPGRVAVTIDMAGLAPVSAEIDVAALAGLLAAGDRGFAGQPYAAALAAFAEWFRRAHQDGAIGEGILAAFWLGCRHPEFGQRLVTALSHRLRRDGRAHLTLHVGSECGLAIVLADEFADLKLALDAARAAGVTVVGEREREPETFQ
jgi:hypothetical protein